MNADRLTPLIAALLRPDADHPLGPGTPNREAHARLLALRVETAFAPQAVRDPDMARCCLAGLWLLHNYLDESHQISQEVHTPTGSYWHGLMHRREPDYSNSKYWFHRVGRHAVFAPLAEQAARLAGDAPAPAALLARQAEWDPFAFVDLCEASEAPTAPCHELCRRVQRAEWELLFAWCCARAVEG